MSTSARKKIAWSSTVLIWAVVALVPSLAIVSSGEAEYFDSLTVFVLPALIAVLTASGVLAFVGHRIADSWRTFGYTVAAGFATYLVVGLVVLAVSMGDGMAGLVFWTVPPFGGLWVGWALFVVLALVWRWAHTQPHRAAGSARYPVGLSH